MNHHLQNAQNDLANRRKDQRQPVQIDRLIPKVNQTAVSTTEEPPRTQQPITLNTLDLDWHPKVKTAVTAARAWQARRQAQIAAGEPANASLVLLATGRPNDLNVTGYGCGKTHIARACLWSECFVLDGIPYAPSGTFFEASRLIANLDSNTQPSAEMRGGIVVIDDIGSEGIIAYVAKEAQQHEREARYFKAIDYATQHGVSLIITSNLSVGELADHIGGRAWSRLQRLAPVGFIIDLSGVPDYRRRISGR